MQRPRDISVWSTAIEKVGTTTGTGRTDIANVSQQTTTAGSGTADGTGIGFINRFTVVSIE